MSKVKTISGSLLISEDLAFSQLVIAPDAVITAPEGKHVSMTVGGVIKDMLPGRYSGDIRFTVTEDIPVEFFMGRPLHFKAALCMENGAYDRKKSIAPAAVGGGIGQSHVEGVSVTARADGVNGLYFGGKGKCSASNVKVDLEGNGANDFCGYAAGIMAGDDTDFTLKDAEITTRGVARPAFFSGGNSVAHLENVTLRAFSGTLPADYQDTIMPGQMKCVPWMLGLRGNCRATNLADYGSAYWNNCRMYSEGWGVMSTDGVDKCRLFIRDSHVEITGPSGYGAFAIGDCQDSFDHSVVKVPDYALICANDNSYGFFKNGSIVESGRFGVMFFNNKGGVTAENSTFNTDKTTFLIKGCTPEISVKGCTINAKNGKIIQLFNCDDPGSPEGYYVDPVEKDAKNPEHNVNDALNGKSVLAHFSDMELTGSFYNGTSDAQGDTGPRIPMPPPPDMPGDGPGEPPEGMDMGPKGALNLCLSFNNVKLEGAISAALSAHRVAKVCQDCCEELGEIDDTPCAAVNNGVNAMFDDACEWTVTGPCYMTGLILAQGTKVKAPKGKKLALTVDGKELPVAPGHYEGDILLTVC